MLKILILSIILLILAFAGLAIRILIKPKAEFRGGSCTTASEELDKQGIACGCGGACATNEL